MERYILLISLLVLSVCAEDRWVWSGGHGTQDNNVLTPKIPGRVEPHPRSLQLRVTTPAPDITTFRPKLPAALGRSISSRAHVSNSFLPAFFPFMPFAGFMGLYGLPVTPPYLQKQQQQQQQQKLQQTPPYLHKQQQQQQQKLQQTPQKVMLSQPPSHGLPLPGDGTTKSRVTEDTAYDSVAVLDDEDKYTTLDKHQSEYRRTQPLPRPQEEHLGGLDPREVFYADEDLLIIKGGGFSSDKFKEPSQTLDDSNQNDPEFGQGSHISPLVLPNPDLEYNGNIPAILPPPPSSPEPTHHTQDQSTFAVFVQSPSRTNAMILHIPYVYPRDYLSDTNSGPGLSLPLRETENSQNSLYVKRSAEERPVLQSLSGDTAVNYLEPRPSVNPDAEFLAQDQPQIVLLNQPTPSYQKPQLLYQQPHFVYHYTPVYPYQTVYHQPNRVEVYNRPHSHTTRARPKL